MSARLRVTLVCTLALSLALELAACRPSNVYEAHGVVREVDVATGQAVIEHEEIPGLMSAMTMSFDVPDKELLAQLAPGQHIDFELEVTERSYRVIAATTEGATAGAARSPSLASALQQNDVAPSFSLVDQAGRSVTLADLKGKIVVVDFIFTRCPGPCPIMTSRQVELQRALPAALHDRVQLVSITLDPKFDTPAVLQAYAQARGADLSNWSFLTGFEPDVAEVVRRFGVGTLRAADGNIDHALATFLIDGEGRIARRWLGLEHPVDELRSEVEALADLTPPPSTDPAPAGT